MTPAWEVTTVPRVIHPRHRSASELEKTCPDALALAWIGECSCGATVVRRWRDVKRNWDDSPHECAPKPTATTTAILPVVQPKGAVM
jgi:hypothetical protein